MYSEWRLSMRVHKKIVLPNQKYLSRPFSFHIMGVSFLFSHILLYTFCLFWLLNQTIVSRNKVKSLLLKLCPSNLTHQCQSHLYICTLIQPYEPFNHLLRKYREVLSKSHQEDKPYMRHKFCITTPLSRQRKLSRK